MEKKNSPYKEVLKEKDYRALLISTMVNRFGDALDAVAFTWLVYQVTHSGSWSAIIFGLNMFPNVIVQPFAGAIVEKKDKKRMIVGTHILRGALLTVFLIVFLSGSVNGWIMALFTLMVTSIEAFNMPAGTAFIPRVLKKENLTHGMSLSTMMSGVVTFVGTGLAGVLIAAAGIKTVMIIDIATFFIAAMIIMTIKAESPKEEQTKAEPYINVLKEGFRYIKGEPVIINFCIVAVMLNMILVPINSLQAPLVSECYHMDSSLLSVIGMAGSIGAIAGSFVLPFVKKKLSIKMMIIYFGMLLGMGIVLTPIAGSLTENAVIKSIFAALCFLIMTFCASLITGAVNIEFISNVDERYLARSSAVFISVATAAIPVTSMFVGFIKISVNTSTLISTCGLLTMIFSMIILFINPVLDMEKGNTNAAETV
ncbi:MAG: MFS transporter [Lachnospiraceae bacterium]|nr:MFS transporter [Lachnospiraceae bacterium]